MGIGMPNKTRKENDFLGELEIPADAYWGTTTQRAIENFQISGKKFPDSFIFALVNVKKACLMANMEIAHFDKKWHTLYFMPLRKFW